MDQIQFDMTYIELAKVLNIAPPYSFEPDKDWQDYGDYYSRGIEGRIEVLPGLFLEVDGEVMIDEDRSNIWAELTPQLGEHYINQLPSRRQRSYSDTGLDDYRIQGQYNPKTGWRFTFEVT